MSRLSFITFSIETLLAKSYFHTFPSTNLQIPETFINHFFMPIFHGAHGHPDGPRPWWSSSRSQNPPGGAGARPLVIENWTPSTL